MMLVPLEVAPAGLGPCKLLTIVMFAFEGMKRLALGLSRQSERVKMDTL